ncbi:TPM domain-containing protein [Sphingomonas rosea]
MLAACGQSPPPGGDPAAAGQPARVADGALRGRVIDTADVLTPIEEKAIAGRLAALAANQKKAVVIVTVVPKNGDSMERVGWAVGGKTANPGTLLMLIDPQASSVRLEGELSPADRALVAAAILPDLREQRYGAAIGRGLDRLQGLVK